jgi:hypothetical protein
LSEAEALTLIVPDTVDPPLGDVMLTVGAVVSAFDTVTLTGSEYHRTPSESRATAVSVCDPLLVVVVFQETE